MLAYIDPILPYVDPMLASVASILPYVDPMFTYVGLPNALPHSSDRNGGGGDGVGRGSPDQVGGWGGEPL